MQRTEDRATCVVIASLFGLLGASTGCKPTTASVPTPAPATSSASVAGPLASCQCFFVGGDARDDRDHVVPWAFRKAREVGASAFVFLGDMELTPEWDPSFKNELAQLDPIQFFPVLGNHEVKRFGFIGTDKKERVARFEKRFLSSPPRTPVSSQIPDRVAYSVDLADGVHFVALDNVTDKGFGQGQLDWLQRDLTAARSKKGTRYVVVGMHKALARNGKTTHSMDEDGDVGVRDSAAALKAFHAAQVNLLLQSHEHVRFEYEQEGIPSYITGGLGAPVPRKPPPGADTHHHVLRVDVRDARLDVTVIPFEGATTTADTDEDEGRE